MSDSDHQKSHEEVRNNASDGRHPDAKSGSVTEGKQVGLDADADADTKPSPLKNPIVKWGLIAAAVIAVIAGILWYLHYQSTGKFMQTTDDAYIQADTVTVSSKVAGYVERVFVADDEQVKAGTPLLRLDSREYRAQAAQAGSQIDVSRANAEGVAAQFGEQRATIARARADLAAAISAGVFADAEVARYEPLAATGAETREKLSQMRDQARQAHAQAVSARAAMLGAERHIATLQAQARQARAQGKGAEAQLAAVTVNVDSTLIRASIDGRIGDKTVRVGQYIQPATRMMSKQKPVRLGVPIGADRDPFNSASIVQSEGVMPLCGAVPVRRLSTLRSSNVVWQKTSDDSLHQRSGCEDRVERHQQRSAAKTPEIGRMHAATSDQIM